MDRAQRMSQRTRALVIGLLLPFAFTGTIPAIAAIDSLDLRQQLRRDVGLEPIAPGEARGAGDSSDARLPPTSSREPPVRLRLVRSEKRVEVVRGDTIITMFPVSVGKPGYETPVGVFQVLQMEHDPVFRNPFDPADVRPSGSHRNPLGPRWIAFRVDGGIGIGFHGTDLKTLEPSHGCVRMHNSDVVQLFEMVTIGTVVEVVP